MNKIEWLTDGVTLMPDIDAPLLEKWIAAVAKTHNRIVGPLTYIFCDDPKIIEGQPAVSESRLFYRYHHL